MANFTRLPQDKVAAALKDWLSGKTALHVAVQHGIGEKTMRNYIAMYKRGDFPLDAPPTTEPSTRTVARQFVEAKKSDTNRAKLLFLDIESLPNEGWFFATYSDRSIPLQFIKRPKAVCTIAYKFAGDESVTVLCTAKPYEDKDILQQLLPVVEKAHYVVWHYGEGFDRQFIDGRLFAHGLPALPPVHSVDTYKLARQKFGKTLNSNKLDHLGDILGLGRKNKTDATLWVRCAQGDQAALQEMAEYNAQDVELLEAVYYKLAPNAKPKVNHNLLHDDAVLRCKPCGSTNIELKGYELVNTTFRHRYQCKECGGWSTFPKKQTNPAGQP